MADIDIRAEVPQVRRQIDRALDHPGFLNVLGESMVDVLMDNTKEGVGESDWPVDTGLSIGGFDYNLAKRAQGIITITNDTDYAIYVEERHGQPALNTLRRNLGTITQRADRALQRALNRG